MIIRKNPKKTKCNIYSNIIPGIDKQDLTRNPKNIELNKTRTTPANNKNINMVKCVYKTPVILRLPSVGRKMPKIPEVTRNNNPVRLNCS